MGSEPVIQHLPLKSDERFKVFGTPAAGMVKSECGFVEVSETKGVSKMTQERQKRGNPYKRGDTWTIDYSFEDPATGKKIRKRKGGYATKKEAEKALAIKKAKILQGDLSDEIHDVSVLGNTVVTKDVSFKDYAEIWLEMHKEKVSFGTYRQYKNVLKFIYPVIGDKKLNSINRSDITYILQNVADGRVKTSKAIVSMVFKNAVIDDIIDKDPCQYIDIRKLKHKNRPTLTAEQASKLVQDSLENDKISPIIILALFLGLRQGEILALKYSDFNFDKHEVKITKQISLIAPKVYGEKEPKTLRSIRTLYLPLYVEQYIKERYKKLSANGIDVNSYICIVDATKDIHWRGLQRRIEKALKAWGESVGIENLSIHCLRHTCATLLIKNGVPAKKVSDLLGHANISTTIDIYCDVFQAQEDVANTMQSIIVTI